MFALLFWQIKSVCSKLRSCGVQGHLGVFSVHYETDNSRLYVVCAKHLTEAQLLNEFKVFGTAEVKLITDVNGFSKVDLFSFIFFSSCQTASYPCVFIPFSDEYFSFLYPKSLTTLLSGFALCVITLTSLFTFDLLLLAYFCLFIPSSFFLRLELSRASVWCSDWFK